MNRIILLRMFILPFVIASCSGKIPASGSVSTQASSGSGNEPIPTQSVESAPSIVNEANPSVDLTRSDQQGAVIVAVTPLNLADPSGPLEFDVALETHSVDLSMDLAVLSTLTTDTGISVQATLWDAPRGGHHVSGKLIFPALLDGKPILDGAKLLTLTILDVDASARLFEWKLN